ncbi:hypothetical protein GJU39_16710 [Pedobacter petrophilus]|uniref:2'-5' RNA ligase family protein n=1 Tax=Pedobacter petrophilus TaxID=1908241 RepID=A0A7K0G376_9SPHI|nr:2'-5' RNA ligase family protein [Pedobacter petrophilus]MRX77729.1 hypothetical protein [Pedobacter petrophilus]
MENLFLICLIPPASIVEDVDKIRNYIADEFKVYESLKRPAHITLIAPLKITSGATEKRFFSALSTAVFSDAFTQVLSHFNAFPPHTFYLNVEQNRGIMSLQSEIKKALNPLKLDSQRDNFKFTPHLTLAFKDVKPPVFESIIKAFKDRKFKRAFTVSGFSVYKHIDKKWQPYKEFQFRNPQENPSKRDLFNS